MGVLRRELRSIGDVGEATLAEYRELSERHSFLVAQVDDLEKAGAELQGVPTSTQRFHVVLESYLADPSEDRRMALREAGATEVLPLALAVTG